MDNNLPVKKHHPALEEFFQQNPRCDEDAGQKTFAIYQDLVEVKGWWYPKLAYCDMFNRPYITGQPTSSDPIQVVIPVGAEEKLSLNDMHQYFANIFVEDEPVESVMLAIKDVDTTTVYYNITKGLSPPDSPEAVAKSRAVKSQRLNRKRQVLASCVSQAQQRISMDKL